ncbi:MAG TPA: 3'-5' exonuclease, partial [Chlamydiales bacterium]|nr:3'-5' exonuclease [Chlamydiales bacterium]
GGAIQTFFSTHFIEEKQSLQEKLVSSVSGRQRYHELRQMIEWIAGREAEMSLTPESCLLELESMFGIEPSTVDQGALRPLAEKEAVSILTLHMSKGLEFEVVFALGVVNRSPVDEGIITVREDGKIFLKSVSKEDPSYSAYLEENDAEKSRQLYVALTRARTKLYIPVIDGWKAPSLGTASSLELFLARMMEPKTSWMDLYERLKESRLEFLQALVEKCPDCAIEKLQKKIFCAPLSLNKNIPCLVEPKTFEFFAPMKYSVSFTGLVKRTNVPVKIQAHNISLHTLPIGTSTGELVHKILEEIPLSLIKNADESSKLHPFIHRFTSGTIFEPWKEHLADMIFSSFKSILDPLGICLDQIEEGCCFREREFMYPLKCAEKIPECASMDGVVKGVIDLFFIHEQRYYILDWKTNWLGADQAAYSSEALARAMQVHRYDLQACLYRLAVKQYLEKVDPRPFEQIFGGILYFFMRGKAVYFIPEAAYAAL